MPRSQMPRHLALAHYVHRLEHVYAGLRAVAREHTLRPRIFDLARVLDLIVVLAGVRSDRG